MKIVLRLGLATLTAVALLVAHAFNAAAFTVIAGAPLRTATTACSPAIPGGALSGDTLLMELAVGNQAAATISSGWTQVAQQNYAGTGDQLIVYAHTYTSGDPNPSASWTTAAAAGCVIMDYGATGGVDQTSLDTTTGNATQNSLSVTPSAVNDELVMLYADASLATFTATSKGSLDLATSNAASPNLAIADLTLVSAAATGNQTATASAVTNGAGLQITLKAAGATPTPAPTLTAQATATPTPTASTPTPTPYTGPWPPWSGN